jgi:prepilin peptidase CpaA
MTPPVAILLLLLVITAAVFDIRTRRIPNWLTLTGIILGFALNAILQYPYPLTGVKHSGFGLLFAFAIYFVLYLIHAMGAGDVKLMAAIGAIIANPANWFLLFIVTALIGGLFALTLLLAKGRLRKTFGNVAFMLHELGHARAPYMSREELDVQSPKAVTLPHGFTIAVGCLIFVAGSIFGK